MGEGKTDEAKGRIKEATGSLTDNKRLEAEGSADRAKGSVKDVKGDVEGQGQGRPRQGQGRGGLTPVAGAPRHRPPFLRTPTHASHWCERPVEAGRSHCALGGRQSWPARAQPHERRRAWTFRLS